MHWTRRVGVLYLLIVGWAGFASAQDIVNDSSGVVYLEDFSGSMSLSNDGGSYLLFHRMIGDGVGIRDAYTRLGIRGKIIDDGFSHIFGEAHALITDGPRIGYNVGLGYRRFAGAGLLGGHVWFDDYGSEAGNRYQQITFGAEYLHPDFDLRTNVYLPISDDENFLTITDPGTMTGFAGNNIVTLGQGIYERAFNAYEAEVGIPAPVIEWLRAYVGGYVLQNGTDEIWGARARVEGRVARDVTLNAMVTNDDQFGTNLNLGVEVRLSNQGLPTRFGGQNYSAMARRYDQVQRNWNAHIAFIEDDVNVPLTLGGNALTAIWVDDSAAPGGTGTFESPLNMLPADADSDFVLVRTGNQMTSGNIELNMGQQLLGEGKTHLIQTDLFGVIPLPDEFAQTGPTPTLLGDGTSAPVITLADNTRVSSFNFAAPNAIVGTDITNFHLECLTGTVLNGINVAANGGTGIVNDINFGLLPGGNGVNISNTTGLLNLDLDDITTADGARGLIINANEGDIAYTADNISATGASDAGVALLADTADLSGTVNGLNSSANLGHGVRIDLDNSATGLTQINDPLINGNGMDGIHAVADGGSTYTLNVIGSSTSVASISGNGDDNVDADSINTSTFNVFIDPLTMSTAGDNGFEFMTDTGATLNATLQDIVMQVNTNNAIHGEVTGNSTANLLVTGTNGSGSGMDGVNVTTSNQGELNASIINSIFSGNGDDGYDFTSTSGGVANVMFNNALANGNSDAGLEFSAVTGFNSGPGEVNITATGLNVSNNAINNIRGEATQGGLATLNLSNVNADDGASNGGVVLEATQNGDLTASWVGGSVSNTLNDGVRLNSSGVGSDLSFTMTGAGVNGNANEGIQLDTSASGVGSMSIANSSVTNNGADGIRVTSMNAGQASALLDGVNGALNARNGLNFSASSGGTTMVDATNSTFSNSGSAGAFSGVQGTATDAGSMVTATFDNVDASSNTLHGYQFDVTNQASLWANIESTTGTSTVNSNQGAGVQFTGSNANEALLTMSGPNQFINNGLGGPASGVNYNVNGANLAVAGFSGESSGNSLDGVTVAMTDVLAGAVDLSDGVLIGNTEDGADIDLTNTNLMNVTVGTQTFSGFNVDNVMASLNGLDGVNVNANNTDLVSGSITDLVANEQQNGLVLNLNNGSDWDLEVSNSIFNDNLNNGIHVLSDSNDTMSIIDINNNQIAGNANTNVQVDLTGTANVELHVDDNIIDGDGIASGFQIGTTIQGSTLNDALTLTPDTAGAVGTGHIVEFLNGRYVVYDKDTGAELFASSLDAFWLAAGQANVGGGTQNPRVIYDPTVDRWFMTSVDIANGVQTGNDVYLAVSNTGNPLDGFQSLRFEGDTTGVRFSNLDTLGVDADGLYIGTVGTTVAGNSDVSLFSIPKADLLGATPTLANMTRFDNLSTDAFGSLLQPVVNFGPSDGSASIIATQVDNFIGFGDFTDTILVTDVLDAGTSTATLGVTDAVFTSFNTPPTGGDQPPFAPAVVQDGLEIGATAVEVNGSIWTVHAVEGFVGTDAIQWYEIDAATNTIVQSGVIQDANLDFLFPSIAVNDSGKVVIGMSVSGPNQFISSGAVLGETVAGVTTFQAPTVLNAGVATYDQDFGNGNLWGQYSTTVVDPTDSNTFWTFQERVVAQDTWGIDIVEVSYNANAISSGMTLNNGVAVNVSGNASLNNSSINNNTITGMGGTAVAANFSNSAMSSGLTINGNDITNNGGAGVDVSIADSSVINSLSISQNTNVSSNIGGPGIQVLGTANGQLDALTISGNSNVTGNGGPGINVDVNNFTLGDVNINNNNPVSGNLGDGIHFSAVDSTLTGLSINAQTVTNNLGDGIDVLLDTVAGTPNVSIDNNAVQNNAGQGIILTTIDTPLGDVSTSQNNIAGNPLGAGLTVNIDNPSGPFALASLAVDGNTVTSATAEGINLSVNQAGPINTVSLSNNTLLMSGADGLLANFQSTTLGTVTASGNTIEDSVGRGFAFLADNSPITDLTFDDNTILNSAGGDGLHVGLTGSPVSGTLAVTNSFMEGNAGDGLDIDLNASSIGMLDISDNAGIIVPPSNIGFMVDINGQHWNNRNLSPTETITQMVWDITATGQEAAVTITGGGDLELFGEASKGLTTVNGQPIDPLAVDQPGILMDGDTVFTFNYNNYDDFQFGHFDIEYAASGATTATTNEADLVGATVTATFSGGQMLSGQLDANGDLTVTQVNPGMGGGISGNTELGIRISAVNGSNIGALNIADNLLDNNGSHGIELQIADSTLPGPGSPGVVSGNMVMNHTAGDAFRLIDPDTNGTVIGLDFIDNEFTDSSGAGINVSLNSESGGLTSTMAGNTITGNGSFGIRTDAIEDAQLNLTIGDTAQAPNTISMNQDAAIAVTMSDTTTGSLTVVNTSASDTTNGADANFNGEGLAVRLADNASLSSLVIGDPTASNTLFLNNASDGVQISADLNTSITSPTIQNIASSGNNGDGLNIVRSDDAIIDNAVITGSAFTMNSGDGIDIIAGISDRTDEYDVTNNLIDANSGRGLAMQVQFDSDIVTNITGNTITNNTGGSGIDFSEVVSVNPMNDTRSITAFIDNNTISNNGTAFAAGAGIDVQARHDLTISNNTIDNNSAEGINLAAGAANPADPTMILNNTITNNGDNGLGHHGVDIANANMSVVIDGNTISGNGDFFFDNGNGINNVLGVDSTITNNTISGNADNGIALENGTHTINNNMITNNQADGIEAVSNSDTNGLVISADGNQIISNGARGFNTLIVGNTLADITFSNGLVQGNGLEGVYVYQTTSTNRDVDTDPNNPLFEGFGDITSNPQLVFNFHNNQVLTNGTMSGFEGTGLVMLIGTSGASTAANNYEDDGGLVSDGMGFTAANLTGRGGVLASITGNNLDGNVGIDVLIQSFDSTLEPFSTVGTWDDMNYDYSAIIPYEQDPLARLDLQFEGNTGGLADVVRGGYFHGFFSEDEFKSRTTSQITAGPFTDGSRLRNSQRLAFRGTNAFGDFSDPAVNTVGAGGDSANFLYPGVGGSTFRVTAGSNTMGFTDMNSDDFTDLVFDGTAWDGATTATIFGELPFGYDIIP